MRSVSLAEPACSSWEWSRRVPPPRRLEPSPRSIPKLLTSRPNWLCPPGKRRRPGRHTARARLRGGPSHLSGATFSLCELRKEHKFPPGPVGRASDFLEGVAVCRQIRLDLVALAETKCRGRGQ